MANPYPHHHMSYASPTTLYSSGLVIPTSNSRPGSPQTAMQDPRKRGAEGEAYSRGDPGKRARIEEGYARHPQSTAGGGVTSAETEDIMAGIRGAFTTHPSTVVNSAHSYPGGPPYPTYTAAQGFAAPGGFGRQQAHSQTPVGDEEEDEGESDEEDEGDKGRGEAGGTGEERKRPKMTRGSRACTVCRRLKMKCVEADIENGVPCKRCRAGNLNCVFEESLRGKKSNRGKKSEAMAKSLKKMEETLHTVLRSIHNPELSARLASTLPETEGSSDSAAQESRSTYMPPPMTPSSMSQPPMTAIEFSKLLRKSNNLPSNGSAVYSPGQASTTGSILSTGPGTAPLPIVQEQGNTKTPLTLSPRLQSLPDNAINPLGLLAEASLQNSHRKKSFTGGAAGAARGLAEGSRGTSVSANGNQDQGVNGSNAGDKTSSMGANNDLGPSALDDVEEDGAEGQSSGDAPRFGVSHEGYFKPGGMTIVPLRAVLLERELKPEILTFITPDEVHDLFDIYYSRIHPQVPVLSKVLHTPSSVCSRSPFLLTTVCAIASRYYDKKRDLYPRLAAVARRLVWDMSAKGYKSVEIIQAFLLQACYTLSPTERWEQDQSYMLLGMAVRMGLDLNLYRKNEHGKVFTDEDRTRAYEIQNRERTWILAVALDQSRSAQMGKPCTAFTDVVIQSAQSPMWYGGPYSQPEDIQLGGYLQLQRIIARALQIINSPSQAQKGLAPSLDYNAVLRIFQEELDAWQRWCLAPYDELNERGQGASRATVEFYYNYNTLLLASFGLENAIQRTPIDVPLYFHKVYESAWAISEISVGMLATTNEIAYFTDSQNVFLSYAMLSLLKLLKPEFKKFISDPHRVLDRVNDVINVMNAAARDPQHSPGLYAVLLRSIVNSKREDMKSEATTDSRQQNLMFSMHPTSSGVVDPQQLLADPANQQSLTNTDVPQSVTMNFMGDDSDNVIFRRLQTSFVSDPAKAGMGAPNAQPQLSANSGPTLAGQHEASVPSTPAGPFGNGSAFAGQDSKSHASWPRATGQPATGDTPMDSSAADFGGLAATPATSRSNAGHQNLLNGLWSQMNHGYSEGNPEVPPQAMQQMPQQPPQPFDINNMFGIQDLQWDSSLLLPGFDGFGNLELSGGLIHTRFGSGFISPSFTPLASRQGSPVRSSMAVTTPHPTNNTSTTPNQPQ